MIARPPGASPKGLSEMLRLSRTLIAVPIAVLVVVAPAAAKTKCPPGSKNKQYCENVALSTDHAVAVNRDRSNPRYGESYRLERRDGQVFHVYAGARVRIAG
jgi:hypothetical protein